MTRSSLDNQLDILEAQFRDVGASLMAGNPELLESTGARFQQMAVELKQIADGMGRMQLKSTTRTQRIRALVSGMGVLRENLLRQSAYVDRALGVLVPSTGHKATYAGGGGAFNRQVRQSGAFTVLSA